MIIRHYEPIDCEHLAKLFYETVHTVNAEDYSQEQLNVWATGNMDLTAWNASLCEHYTVVAVENDSIVGFGDIDKTGYLSTHSSVTAKPFFMQRGFAIVKEQQVVRNGIALKNYIMEKQIRSSLRGAKRQSNPENIRTK